MAERTLTDRIRAGFEEADDRSLYSIALLIAAEVERELADHDRRLERVEGPVLYGRTIAAHAAKEAMP
jgi:hypothetical protein